MSLALEAKRTATTIVRQHMQQKSPQDVSASSPNGLSPPLWHKNACVGYINEFESRLIARFKERVKREERLS